MDLNVLGTVWLSCLRQQIIKQMPWQICATALMLADIFVEHDFLQ